MLTKELVLPNRAALWSKLALTKTQLALLCGVTTRQIGHWTARGYIHTCARDDDRFDGAAVDRVALIKEGLQRGLPLRQAVRLTDAVLSAQQTEQPGPGMLEPTSLKYILDQLLASQAAINAVIEVIEPLVPRERKIAIADAEAA
ncbi:MAG: MerR family transcriptional regulator [Chloroflexia bacterium]